MISSYRYHSYISLFSHLFYFFHYSEAQPVPHSQSEHKLCGGPPSKTACTCAHSWAPGRTALPSTRRLLSQSGYGLPRPTSAQRSAAASEVGISAEILDCSMLLLCFILRIIYLRVIYIFLYLIDRPAGDKEVGGCQAPRPGFS